MRTIVDIPEAQLKELAAYCAAEKISRAEAVRRAIAALPKKTKSPKEARRQFYGLWKGRTDIGDAVEYQRTLRAEWDDRTREVEEAMKTIDWTKLDKRS
jgi:hypothetical protein